jgi:hypothetical protein
MTYGFRGLREAKNGRRDDVERLETGSEESSRLTDTPADDIDPAEFFDPEEFGYRRRDLKRLGA